MYLKDSSGEEIMVSIIIPVYNGEKYIRGIVDNINHLRYSSYEVIFINDGSTDNSAQVLREVQSEHSYITVIHQENRGVCAARNEGLANATGDYICFLDVDDAIDYSYLNVFIENMEKGNMDVAFCDMTPTPQEIELDNIPIKIYSRKEVLNDFLLRKFKIGVCGMLVSKKVIDDKQLAFMVGYKYGEDLHMAWKIFNSVERVMYIQAPMYVYRQNEGSAMTKIDKSKIDAITIMDELEGYFKENNPEFYPTFKKYGAARNAWAILWQAVRYLDYEAFVDFTELHDFSAELRKLITFPDIRVKLSSVCFVCSKAIYYYIVRILTKNYRN